MTLALAALVAALPAAAIAQDAGTNQYQDPLAGEPGAGGNGNGNSGGGNTNPSGSGTQGVQSDTSAGNTQAAQNQLPATGADAWLLALAGGMLLAGGLGLRRVADRPHV